MSAPGVTCLLTASDARRPGSLLVQLSNAGQSEAPAPTLEVPAATRHAPRESSRKPRGTSDESPPRNQDGRSLEGNFGALRVSGGCPDADRLQKLSCRCRAALAARCWVGGV